MPRARRGSLQEAIDCSSFQNGYRSLRLILGVIAEHMRQHLGVEDAARRRDEGTEILLSVERVAKADAFSGEMRGGDARTLIGGDLHAFPVFARGPGAVELAAGAGGVDSRICCAAGAAASIGEIVAQSSSRTRDASSTSSTAGPSWRSDRPRSMAGRSPGRLTPPTRPRLARPP